MRIRDYIGAVSRAASERGMARKGAALISGARRLARTDPEELMRRMSGMGDIAKIVDAETSSWAEPEDVLDPSKARRFDVCDLRAWIRIAEAAGVPFVPAKEVARLSEEELDSLLGKVSVPEIVRRDIAGGVAGASAGSIGEEGVERIAREIFPGEGVDPASSWAKMEGALDEIPASWMVRTQYSGSGNLKALVGTGLMLKADDTARVREDFEIGGGWVRAGNRRIIDFSDPRFVQMALQGHKPGISYLARPWAAPARYHEGEDVHRAGSPISGPGKWPAEWRVFVKNGTVTGVANYYAWTGEGATPQNAWNAVEAAALAQRIADEAACRGLVGAFMNQELFRIAHSGRPEVEEAFSSWDPNGLHASIDMMETENGLTFLEAGPAHAPGSGAHPCAFAGHGVDRSDPRRVVSPCDGVAFLMMPHVDLADARTWVDGDADGRIMGWRESFELAREFAPLSENGQRFLEDMGRRTVPSCGPEFG